MSRVRHLVAPVDFSDSSSRALEAAAALAARLGATLTVLHVYGVRWMAAYAPGAPELPSVALTEDDREALRRELDRFVDRHAVPRDRVTTALREGAVVEEILAAAGGMQPADLLVIGSHGRTGVGRMVLGSVAERVLRGARCPVLTIGAGATTTVPEAGFARVLAGLDFSAASRQALAAALPLLAPDAHVSLFHVMELLPDLPDYGHETTAGGPRSLDDYIAAYEEDSRVRLGEAATEARAAGVRVTIEVRRGRPHVELLRQASEAHADLLVLGTHGGGLVDRLFVGSTAQQVVRQAPCAVLTRRT
jgi:nucleotide-binding universal stress UspA family protein